MFLCFNSYGIKKNTKKIFEPFFRERKEVKTFLRNKCRGRRLFCEINVGGEGFLRKYLKKTFMKGQKVSMLGQVTLVCPLVYDTKNIKNT